MPTISVDNELRLFQQGSEGWAVFKGPKMLISHLSKHGAEFVFQLETELETSRVEANRLYGIGQDYDVENKRFSGALYDALSQLAKFGDWELLGMWDDIELDGELGIAVIKEKA